MQIYDNADQLWQEYLDPTHSPYGFDGWTVTTITHTSDAAYAQATAHNQDKLGFQPTLFTFANPLQRQSKSAVVKNLPTTTVEQLKQQLRERYALQFDTRFGLFDPSKYQADALYDTWEDFAHEWIEQKGSYRLPYNLPVLLDHVSDLEYWAWQQKNFNPVGNQRLIITVFQPRTSKFADIFINHVNDNEAARIKLLLSSHVKLNLERLLYA